MQSTDQKQAIALKAKLFRGFADSSRLSILETLRARTMTVSEIVSATGLSQSNVSNHLACLRDCGLVEVAQQGRFAQYRLNGQSVGELLDLADRLLADFAQGIYACTRYNVKEDSNGTSANQ
jgi:ArsR family transcriptional regulator, cadmium/lead-responsive transcriptional repressor